MDRIASVTALIDDISRALTVMAERGWSGFDCSAGTLDRIGEWGTPPGGATAGEDLETIRRDLGECTRCPLHRGRTQIVFGAGDPHARLMFVGEGPGFDEDRQGEPFVGAAGQLLTKIIEAMQLSRNQVYIGNVVKCRPPGNRNPEPGEIQTCLPFLKRQIAAVRPDFICALGSISAQTLLETDVPISRLRGRFHDYGDNMQLMPTFHPAFLLRNPAKKRQVWEDVQKLMKALGIVMQDKQGSR